MHLPLPLSLFDPKRPKVLKCKAIYEVRSVVCDLEVLKLHGAMTWARSPARGRLIRPATRCLIVLCPNPVRVTVCCPWWPPCTAYVVMSGLQISSSRHRGCGNGERLRSQETPGVTDTPGILQSPDSHGGSGNAVCTLA